MEKRTINFGEVVQSIKELTHIYKPTEKGVDKFVKDFVRKYNVHKGFEDELKTIVLNELKNLK